MNDRLPAPLEELHRESAERASATPARATPGHSTPLRTVAVADATMLRDVQSAVMSGITGSELDAELASSLVTPSRTSSARERFEVYRFGYLARLVDCLADDYPALSAALGHEAFESLATRYIERFPSSGPSLNWFGRRMSSFCVELDAATAISLFQAEARRRFFSELCLLEWAIVAAIHAPDAKAFDLAGLQGIAPERLGEARLAASGSARLLRFTHPVNAFYQAVRPTDPVPPVPPPGPSATVVYRRALTIWRMDLTPAMTRVLSALFDGLSIGESLARIGVDEADPSTLAEAERSVMVWFREWVQAGFFSGAALE